MDKQLHGISPFSVDIGTLVKNFPIGDSPPTFLFEPTSLVPFEMALGWQRGWQRHLFDEPQSLEAVWMLQHPHCYTLGRGASKDNLLFDEKYPPFPLYRTDRGGEVTHHLPGQIIVYPVLNLMRHSPDLAWYLRQLELVVIDVMDDLGLTGETVPGMTGVWIGNVKVAAIGIGCRRWITQHGFALNVNCDLDGFSAVIPCGLEGLTTGSLESWIPGLSVHEVQPLISKSLGERFRLTWLRENIF